LNSKAESHGGIDRIDIPSFLITTETYQILHDSDLNNAAISSILSVFTDKDSIIKAKLQFANKDVKNIFVHAGEISAEPMDDLFRNDYSAIAFTFLTRHLQCFENYCKP
jgi:hypothetical protein